MVETYQISTQGVMDGYCKDQVAELLMILFKRDRAEIQPILDSKGYVLKRGINLASALRYKGTLEQRGCKCSVEKLDGPHKLSADFPDTVMMQIDTDWALIHDTAGGVVPGMQGNTTVVPGVEQHQIRTETAAAPAPVPDKNAYPAVRPHVVTNEIGTTIQDDPFFVQTPQSMCCNCATKTAVSAITTPFVKQQGFFTGGEKKQEIELELAYCPACAESIGHYPMRRSLKSLLGFAIWLLVFMWLASTFNLPHQELAVRLLIVAAALVPAILALRWIGQPKKPMTSKYTPVIILEYAGKPSTTRQVARSASMLARMSGWLYQKAKPSDPDKIKRLTIRFSNPVYAKAFRKANKAFIQNGFIKIV